jgi:hypothetical protein
MESWLLRSRLAEVALHSRTDLLDTHVAMMSVPSKSKKITGLVSSRLDDKYVVRGRPRKLRNRQVAELRGEEKEEKTLPSSPLFTH